MTPYQKNQILHLQIHGIGSSGEGVGYIDGYTVFVDGALPGEEVEAKLFLCQKRYGKAHLVNILKPSLDRVTPVCKLFGTCGGCQLMHLSYAKQLEIKTQKVIDALQRIGKLEHPQVLPCMASPSDLHYRNKIQLPVRPGVNGLSIGLYARASHDLVEVENCHIHCTLGEDIYRIVRGIIKNSNLPAYDPTSGKGELRHLLIKSAINSQQALVVLVSNQPATPALTTVANQILARCPSVKGVVHNLNTENDNVILGRNYQTLVGEAAITENLCGLTFKVSPASFFQVNPHQAENLYRQALTFASLTGAERVLDAYCGVGTLSLLFAQSAKEVIGVECVPEAIKDAKANAALNQISNATFVCEAAERYIQRVSAIDLILLNPPRKGCEVDFLDKVGELAPREVIYVSCDPATLARDIAHLAQFGYRTHTVQPFDMFPQTAHVECVAKLMLSK